ncbi:MAG: YfcE family phosphodiesterase [Desulfobacterales bacterium]|nr:YfcE family phosphodiesterase [Desulfobacterales bacterium]
MKIKIGVLSDTHLHQVTKEFRKIYEKYLSDKDVILHAGDVVSTEILDFLSKKNFHGVCGNMDPFDVAGRLPIKKVIKLGPYRLALMHGWGSSNDLENRIQSEFKGVDAIIYGHSHRAANHVSNGILLFNPGTATGFTSSGMHSIGTLELTDAIKGEIIKL